MNEFKSKSNLELTIPMLDVLASMQNVSESATKAPATATASNPIPSPPGVTRTATRIEKAVPRATLTDEEMDAIMVCENLWSLNCKCDLVLISMSFLTSSSVFDYTILNFFSWEVRCENRQIITNDYLENEAPSPL